MKKVVIADANPGWHSGTTPWDGSWTVNPSTGVFSVIGYSSVACADGHAQGVVYKSYRDYFLKVWTMRE